MADANRPGRGSTLLLMPAALLVVVVLGALAVDVAAVHQAQRELIAAAQAAANDAAVAAWDTGAFYREGEVRLDRAAATREARATLAAIDPSLRLAGIEVTGDEVRVRVTGWVRPVFGAAAPGAPDRLAVHGRARAELAR